METLWASFVIKGPQHNIFFGADSGWFPGFAEIGEAFGPFDLTMLESWRLWQILARYTHGA
jgi:L-ascorbate metabolism protein UlaG (beta-lactamase superfamily)